MYSASAQFHNAVFGNSPVERVLFKFADGTIFTNEDIHIGNGLKVIEAVNLEEELTIGACPASSMDVTVMNYHGLLSGFAFGEAEVSLGVRTNVGAIAPVDANTVAVLRYETEQPLIVTGHDELPYLRINGDRPTAQPPFPVKAIMTMGDTIFCISADGEVWQATWVDGQTWNQLGAYAWDDLSDEIWDAYQGILVTADNATIWQDLADLVWDDLQNVRWNSFWALVEFNDFMTDKFKQWANLHTGISYDGNISYEFYTDGRAERYEYVKLGTFLLNTPAKRKVNMIAVSALDRMSLFDVVADDFWNDLAYPITIGEIFTQLCAFVGVPKATVTFINSTRSFTEAPMVAEGITAREILGWIAEAACSFARMTRDGEVELAWFGVRPVSIPMTQYFSIAPAEYEVAQVDKLQISGSETDIGMVIGEGTNGYQILDNPLLYGATDNEVRTLGVPIYNRLIAYAPFSPIVAAAVCDWSIQAGDIIEIDLNGVPYSLPVYTQTITWKGNARVAYESTGAEKRPVMTATNRRLYKQKRAIHEVSETVDGLTRRIEDTEGNVANLELFADSLTLSIANGSTSSTLKLMAGSTELSSQNITFNGMVTFSNLTDGTTTISGSNITTGTVEASRIDVDNLYVKHLNGADGTFSGSLSAADGTFTDLTGTGYVSLGTRVTIDTSGITLLGDTDSVRIFMNPPTASGGSEARWVSRDSYYSLGIYTSKRSDKKDISDVLDECSEIIDQLRPVYFRFKSDPEDANKSMGFIAEETDLVCKELTSYSPDGLPVGVQYSNITAVLTAEVKRLRQRVKKLEEMMEGL